MREYTGRIWEYVGVCHTVSVWAENAEKAAEMLENRDWRNVEVTSSAVAELDAWNIDEPYEDEYDDEEEED